MSQAENAFTAAGENDALNTIGGRIKWARKQKRMTQDDLARAFPPERVKKRAVVGQYETGGIVPSLEVLSDLASILSVDASFLAFGEGPAQSARSRAIPVYQDERDEPDPEHLMVPLSMLDDLALADINLTVVRLSVDATAFAIRADDYVLVDIDRSVIAADGLIYAVHTTVGPALVRSEPLLTRSKPKVLQLCGGQGSIYTAASDDIEVIGCLVGAIQRRL